MSSNFDQFLQSLGQLVSSCNCTTDLLVALRSYYDLAYESDKQDMYSKPMLWIGIYIAVASLLCILPMVADVLHGYQNRKLWFPCRYFTLNAASLTVIAVATKLPMDLNNSMPGHVDQSAKLGSMAFMCTIMANLLPSLSTMDNRELFTNIIALAVLVITLLVNVCIQLKTGVVSYNKSGPMLHFPGGGTYLDPNYFYKLLAIVYVAMVIMLLIIHISSSLAILKSKEMLELKYQAVVKGQEFQQAGKLTVEKLKQLVRNYWIMAATGSPQFMTACSATTSASGVICAISTVIHILIMLAVCSHIKDYQSNYKWSMLVILITQFVGVVLGSIAPICRCFASLSFKLSIKRIWYHVKVFKVESYWTEKLYDWKQSSVPFAFRSRKCMVVIQKLKIVILGFCIKSQKAVVVACKMIALVPIFFVIWVLYFFRCWKWLKAKFSVSDNVLGERPEQLEENKVLSRYVLELQDNMKLAERTLKDISKSVNRLMLTAEKKQPNNLMKLLERSRGFLGVERYDSLHVLPLLGEGFLDCWSLPLVTLTTIAVSLPNLEKDIVDNLLKSVSEGLVYVKLVEESFNATEDYVTSQKAAKTLWLEVDVYHKWLGNKLQKHVPQVSTTQQILEWFRDTAKNMVTEVEGTDIGGRNDDSMCRSISANSMYRVTKAILLSYHANIEELSSMISDILAACLTNLPQVIARKCHTSAIEKREASVHAAAQLLGETMQIINSLEDRELPSLNPDEMAFIDKNFDLQAGATWMKGCEVRFDMGKSQCDLPNMEKNLKQRAPVTATSLKTQPCDDKVAFKSDVQNTFSKPLLWIGIYIAVASLFCILPMVADLVHGLRNRKLWFPCKYFTLNAATLTVIAIAMKLPMDLNNPMPGHADQAAKLGSMAFMCTMMANFLPSLSTMDRKELLTNIIALDVLVITLVVNVCIQIKTGIVSYAMLLHDGFMYYDTKNIYSRRTATIYAVMSIMLLIIHTCSSLAILKSKQILECKYQVGHQTASRDQGIQQTGILTVERLKQHVRNYWVMAATGSPQFMTACFVTASASGVICALSVIIQVIVILTLGPSTMEYRSDYKWSISVILITQFIGVVLGSIAPICRCFAAVSFKLSIKWIWNHIKVFKVESYWTQTLSDWKQGSVPITFRSRKFKVVIHKLKILILCFCIGFQKTVVVACKMMGLVPIFIVIGVLCCFRCWKWLKATFNASVIVLEKRPEHDKDLSRYVLQLQDDMELAERTLKGISKSVNRLIRRAEKQQPIHLMKLLEESKSFEGVGKFNNHLVPPLSSQEFLDCWSLPLVTLTTIAISLPNIKSDAVDNLLSSVSEGLVYVKLVEESLNATEDYVCIQKAAETLWLEVEVYHKWLGNTLQKSVSQLNPAWQILQWFKDTAKNMVTEVEKTDIGGGYDDDSIYQSISANSMYRITETMLSYHTNIEEVSQEELFEQLSSMISDILAACLTNLPQVIAIKCHTSAIENREASVHAAAQLLGETMQIINSLEDRELPSLNPDEMAFIDKWHTYFQHPLP
ncbi:hypothetical protein OSB04_009369 [Centaurea solstitialis]|uniref:Uncharacterized protein n=1 Tax=Centaurea solstitialis TaxID=347529 RepID=A0AA38THC9_9ASTR|nr:hypothetical protein OSB04_009369 [Centaurea solstitialis]